MERELIDNLRLRNFLVSSSNTELKDRKIIAVDFSSVSIQINGLKRIVNCEFVGGGLFENLNIAHELIFENCIFNGSNDEAYIFKSITSGKLTFRVCNQFNAVLVLENLRNGTTEVCGQFFSDLKIDKGNCNLSIRGVGSSSLSNFKNITFTNAGEFKGVMFRDLIQTGNINFHGSVPRVLNFAQGTFDTIKFHNVFDVPDLKLGSLDTKGNDISVKDFHLHNCNLTGKMEFLGVSFDSISMNHFNSQNGQALFRNIHFKDQVSFESADLSGVRFIDINFLNAKLKLNSTLLTESVFSNIIWPKNNLIEPNLATKKCGGLRLKSIFKKKVNREKEKSKEVLALKMQRESYRQLKVISQKNMNTIDMLAFYRNEMRVYWSNMRLNSELSKGDYFLVFLDRYVSNFGQSWLNPLGLLAFFHALICISIWTFESDDYQFWNGDFFSGVKEYFNWIIPVYKAPEEWGTFATVSGVLGRVLGGFFIYHFIKASRKFGRV